MEKEQLGVALEGLMKIANHKETGRPAGQAEYYIMKIQDMAKTHNNESKTITIQQSLFFQLLNDSNKLKALENCGVDNWEGYDDAMEYLENKED